MIKVAVRYTKRAQADASLMDKLRQPMLLGEAMAQVIAGRVQRRGDLATQPKPYSGERIGKPRVGKDGKNGKPRKRKFVIAQDYASRIGLSETVFDSSADMHSKAGTRLGTFRVSGGMWEGLQIRNFGANGVVIDFAGSSLGGGRQSSKTATGRTRSKSVRIRNQIKAGTVFRYSAVNVIQPKESEQEACGAAVARWSQQMIGQIMGAEVGAFSTSADPTMLRAILQRYEGK